jgi:hypothetical protein
VARTLQTMLDERAGALVGRGRERAALLDLVERDTPVVALVHGIAGVGKSTLLQAAEADARARGATVVTLDGRAFEPTERGFLGALTVALGARVATVEEAGAALAALPGRVLLTIDTYERLRLLDTWLRQRLVPALPEDARLLLAGRDPQPAWQRELGDLARVVRLGELGEDAAEELLRRNGVEGEPAQRIARIARGHPLSLQLAAGAVAERPGLPVEDAALGPIVDELAGHYVAGLDPATRRALDAASVVRRTTLTLLEAMLPEEDAGELFERLRGLPFVELTSEGLLLHDTVRTATSALLQAADPARHRAHRRAAWNRLRAELRTAGRRDLWRYTADMLYLVENPIVRNAFFPSGPDDLVMEPARPEDGDAILATAPDAQTAVWWRAAPDTFRVVRDGEGALRGFSSLFDPGDVPRAQLLSDPVAASVLEHVRRHPVPPGQRILINRYSHSADRSATATIWLDTKRAYLELRPHLRRLYIPMPDVEDTAAVLAPLGFAPVEHGGPTLLMNDFGPGSVDGWLSDVVGRELQAEEPGLVDGDGRRLVLDGRPVDLSRLELDLLRHLQARQGVAVTREELLREVWGHQWIGGSSNVVEVAVSALRRKLGDRASALETVRGVGYRLGPLE